MTAYDIGSYARPLAGLSERAQSAFNEGMVWLYGYNHEAAIDRFERVLAEHPNCTLARWGIAYGVGPNYNKPWMFFSEDERAACLITAHEALDAAEAEQMSPLEATLIKALRARYPRDPAEEDFEPWADAYADAMREVQAAFPQDLDVRALTVEALMNRTPWALWDVSGGAPAEGASTEEARALLEAIFASEPAAWSHPGLLHLYIHLMEMSPWPELALRHGDRLTGLIPDSGHLEHMATHIDLLTGDYATCVARNNHAAAVDRKYFAEAGGQNFYTLYRLHNLHFECYGALFLGNKRAALVAAEQLQSELPEEIVRIYPALFEAFFASRPHVHIRFGDWEAALAEPLLEDAELFAYARATTRYAHTVALANLGQRERAEAALEVFLEEAHAIPEDRMLFNNSARDVLRIGEAMAAGEVAFKAGRIAEGLAHLRDAVQREDGLHYDEPWAWMTPTRHALGALLCEAGEWEEAEAVYRADLGLDTTLPRPCQHPRNVWALRGLDDCLARRGDVIERPHIAADLARALARADVPIPASCFCRSQTA